MYRKILLIQTAFPGDAILATSVLEGLNKAHPDARLDLLIRKGNEGLFRNHPFINKLIVWDKSKNKFTNLLKIISTVRKEKYDLTINLQRFTSTGLITLFSASDETRGFAENPLSAFYTKKIKHIIGDGRHEIERNQELIKDLCPGEAKLPRLYPGETGDLNVLPLKAKAYACVAPGSVWFTKRFPAQKWVEFIRIYLEKYPDDHLYLIGSANEQQLCENIAQEAGNARVVNLAGQHSFLESASLMKDARMNYVNDSAPLHLASAMNAKTTAIFCSTIPLFGFGPLADHSRIVETTLKLSCRPCGIHGLTKCPEGHFKCALSIEPLQLI